MASTVIKKYNRTAMEYAKSRIGTEDKDKLDRFVSLVKPHTAVLDVGCAAGRDTRVLKGMGLDVIGVDLAEKLLAIAKQWNPGISFVQADMRTLPFENNSFGGVWASAVLHHATRHEMPSVLQEFNRVLIPDGILCISTKGGKGTLVTNEARVSNEERRFTLVTAKELHALLVDAGFSKIDLEEQESKSRKGLMWLSTSNFREHLVSFLGSLEFGGVSRRAHA